MAYQHLFLFNAKAILLEEQKWYYLTHNWEDSCLSQGDLSESDRNSATIVRTRLLQFRSPAI